MCNESWRGNESIRDEIWPETRALAEAIVDPSTEPQSPLDRTLAKMQQDIKGLQRANNKLALEISNLKENR